MSKSIMPYPPGAIKHYNSKQGDFYMSIMQEKIRKKQAYTQLDEKDKAFIDRINAVDMGTRKIRTTEMLTICDVAADNTFDLFCMAVRYGFIKGQLAEKARKTKARRKAVV